MQKTASASNDELSFRELVSIIWRDRWVIVLITTLLTIGALVAALVSKKKYEASVIISVVSDEAGSRFGGISSLMSQVGGLASLAGISVGGGSKKAEAIAVLQSEQLTEKYIAENELLPVLYPKLWDPQQKVWKVEDQEKAPTLWKANQLFKSRIRRVTEEAKGGLVTVSITWTDPKTAARWANGLVKLTNDLLRDKAIQESERNIRYLQEEVGKTDVVEARRAIYSILETELNKAMLARGNEEFALKVIDPAVAPEKPSSPKTLLWILGAFVGGLFLSLMFVFARVAWN